MNARVLLSALEEAPPAVQIKLVWDRLRQDDATRRLAHALVRRAVEDGIVAPNLELGGVVGQSPLKLIHVAACEDAVDLLRYLVLTKGVDPNVCAKGGLTPLLVAVEAKREAAAHFLIDEAPGCDLDARTAQGMTALMIAAELGMLPVIKALLAKGAAVHPIYEGIGTALAWAIFQRQEEAALHLLLEGGASWEPAAGRSMLGLAADRGQARLVKAMVGRMRAEGLSQEALATEMEAAATMAAAAGHTSVVKALVEEGLDAKGAMIERAEKSRSTALMAEAAAQAVRDGSLSALKDLVDKGFDVRGAAIVSPDPETGDSFPMPLLHLACSHGQQRLAAFLVDNGCDPLEYDGVGFLPHHYAVVDGHLPLLQWLLRRCPSVHVDAEVRLSGWTALFLAAMTGRLEAVRWLVCTARANPLVERELPFSTYAVTKKKKLRPAEVAGLMGHDLVASTLVMLEVAVLMITEATTGRGATAPPGRNEHRPQKRKRGKDPRREAAAGKPKGGGGKQVKGAPGRAGKENARAKRAAAAPIERPPPLGAYLLAHAPERLVCPISKQLMLDAVTLWADERSYSRAAIERYLAASRQSGLPLTSPVTGLPIDSKKAFLVPDGPTRARTEQYKEAKTREWEAAHQHRTQRACKY